MRQPKTYTVGTLSYTKPKLAVLFFWLFWGDICYMLMESVVPSILPLKLQALGAPNTTMALILTTLPMTINTIFNPIISFRSDRYRSKLGRRIPFILFTIPFLAVCLIALGFGDRIGYWLHERAGGWADKVSPTSAALIVTGVLMVAFSFFNTFVNSAFWYLFNDVVPEELLARFMSWFRMVSMASVSLYNIFIFKYAESHSGLIMTGAAILYVVGFGLMCLNVKEGKYPPPPEYINGKTGVMAAVKTFGSECHSLSHYWFVFLVAMSLTAAEAARTFMLFFYQSTGLTLEMIGMVTGVGNIAVAITIPISGWLADRYHPIRIVALGLLVQVVLVIPSTMIWLIWEPSPQMSYYIWMATSIGLAAPAGALIGVMDPTMFMRIFPRDRYGQFCSANAMWRSASAILNGLLVGVYLDVIKRFWGAKVAYFCLPLWNLLFYSLMLFFMIKLYRSWKRYGGDESYVPPIPAHPVPPDLGAPALVPATAE